MSLTTHEEIGRVRRVGEDVTRMLYKETAVVQFRLYTRQAIMHSVFFRLSAAAMRINDLPVASRNT